MIKWKLRISLKFKRFKLVKVFSLKLNPEPNP